MIYPFCSGVLVYLIENRKLFICFENAGGFAGGPGSMLRVMRVLPSHKEKP